MSNKTEDDAVAEKKTVTESKEVAVKQETSSEVSLYDDFLGDGSDGHEDFAQNDFTVPFLGILQALSKPLQKGHEKYIKGAEQGMIVNSATRELYDVEENGVIVIPCKFQHRYIAWKPDNGGIATDYGTDSTIYDSIEPNEKYKRIDENGNELVDTMEYFCLLVNPETGSWSACVVPFSGTFAKKARKWNNLIRSHMEMKNGKPVKPPLYFWAYEVKTVPESNEKGSWYSWDVADYKRVPELPNGRQLFDAAKELYESIKSGKFKAATEEPEDDDAGDGEGAF